ncbi:8007_t:CDS:2 [Entrophospora sp. SA101]|nr:8007_t:CDS:2 [Entrophospora sp. SA101]CAJ0823369.1 4735_t:CDS:2 [Entrophospora sp. SA101]CAJ0823541.1 3632_t:CDS:2 [Entrophospora sp. SA101]CAJ0837283.1 5844_t:CDS:2 [Entrophospora sp. SA101]CAJ0838083.1 4572_t:CDS:2 [Entrophospora sp. SA101]
MDNNKRRSSNSSDVPRCFCDKPVSICLSERSGILIYDCHYVEHVNPWSLGRILEYDNENKKIMQTVSNLSERETVEEKDVLYNPSTTETMDNDGDDGSDCSKSKENKICAFHVHQPIWNEMCRGESLNNNHPELNTCPFFNFTFCVIFNTITEFPINIPAVPRCYCGKPIVLRRIIRRHNKGKWFMSCASYQIPGARPKCAWFEWANKVLYDKKDQSNISISEEEKDHDDKDVTRHFQEIKDIQINNHDDIDFFNT